MTALTVHRTHVRFWPTVLLAAVAWLIAWIVNLPLANWAAYDLLGLKQGTQVGDAAGRVPTREQVAAWLGVARGPVQVPQKLRPCLPPSGERG